MIYAIIVAAGQGIRMQNTMRKQYIALSGKPILTHTLMAFDRCEQIDQIIVVVPAEDIEYCRSDIIPAARMQKETRLAVGGKRRQDSVHNGLKAIEGDEGIVLIHDGVRPFIKQAHLTACIKTARAHGACILGVPASDTIKQVNARDEIVKTRQRDTLWLAQTPQAFKLDLIKKAHAEAKQEGFKGTDDASLVERQGATVKIVAGSRDNIKITSQEDLALAGALLQVGGSES